MVALPSTPQLSTAVFYREKDKDEEALLPVGASSSSSASAPSRWAAGAASSGGRKSVAFMAAAVLLCITLAAFNMASPSPLESWARPNRTHSAMSNLDARTPGVAELLATAPSESLYTSLRPDLRYLISDSWSGMSGQFTTALAMLYLGRLTQRITLIPSWNDEGHYGRSSIRMSLLFDLEKFRQETGALFVELDDVKTEGGLLTRSEEIGCFRASPWFETGRGFPAHHIQQRTLNAPVDFSYEGFTYFDAHPTPRIDAAIAQAEAEGFELPRNVKEERDGTSDILCLTNLWDLGKVGGGKGGQHPGHYGNAPRTPEENKMSELLRPEQRGVHQEWWQIGQYIDFAPRIWDVALDAVHRTLGFTTDTLPPLVTVHLRRGDFLEWCADGKHCTPSLADYEAAVQPFLTALNEIHALDHSTPAPVVLCTTDGTDLKFLQSIRDAGWYLVDHQALDTPRRLKQMFGNEWRWADSAVDQAILSLGSYFVGTRGSQVSQLSALRVEAWHGGKNVIVDRPQ